jgi:hypothetical protein
MFARQSRTSARAALHLGIHLGIKLRTRRAMKDK